MKTSRPKIAALALLAGLSLAIGGCAGKPGTALDIREATPITFADPSMSHSVAVIGQDTTSTHGPLVTETSKLVDDGMWETNSGGAAKQRISIVVLPDGTIRAGGSAASDLDIGEVESTWTPMEGGMQRSLTFRSVRTSNSAVQLAVNQAVDTLITQWQSASANERAVLEAKLAAQVKIGDAMAPALMAALQALKAAAGVP